MPPDHPDGAFLLSDLILHDPFYYLGYRRTAQSTARNRQWIATSVFDMLSDLGAPVDTQVLVGDRIPHRGGAPGARPLTSEEADRVKEFADAVLVGSRRALLVVFSFAGGTATEVAAMRMGDVNLETATVCSQGIAQRHSFCRSVNHHRTELRRLRPSDQ